MEFKVHYELRARDDRPLPTPMLGDLRPGVCDEGRKDENGTTVLMVLDHGISPYPRVGPAKPTGLDLASPDQVLT
jgi:hypothetical protein